MITSRSIALTLQLSTFRPQYCDLGSGLGTMMATALVHNGARVIIASRKEKQLKEVSCFSLLSA